MENFRTLRAFLVILAVLRTHTVTAKCSYSDYKELFGVLVEEWTDFRGTISELEQSQSPTNSSPISHNNSLDIRWKGRNVYFGRRFRAYFLAPETGDYKFYIACDDFCKLRMSADDDLKNLKTLINVTEKWTDYREWKSSHDAKMKLFKGRSYLLEVIWKQGNGDYHMTVGVQLPDEKQIRTLSNEWLIKYAPEKYRKVEVGQRVLHIKFCSEAKVVVNWIQIPPLCYRSYNTDENKQPEGVFPKVLSKMIDYVCGTLACSQKGNIHKKSARSHKRTSRLHNHKRALHDHKRNHVRGHHRTAFKHAAHDQDKARNSRMRNVRDHGDTAHRRKRSARDQDRTVHDQKRTTQNQTWPVLDFREETVSIHNITNTLSVQTEITLPISMNPEKQLVDREEWVFLPVVEVEGLAMIMRKPSNGEKYAAKLGSSVLERWPVFVMMFAMYCVFGLAVWNLEKSVNREQFWPRFTRGWKQGLWWSFVTMTTVGYGDRYPVTVLGRLLTVVSLLVGVVMNALFIATMTASITVFFIEEAANPERSMKVGVVIGSIEHPLGVRMNGSKGMKSVSYPTRDALLQGLESQAIDGALIDVLTMDSFKKELDDSEFKVVKIFPNTFYYGILLTGGARNVSQLFNEYLEKYPIELLIQEEEESAHPPSKPTVSIQTVSVIPFFETDSLLFKRTLTIIVISLIICVISGLSFHFIWPRLNSKQGKPSAPQKEPTAVKAELTQLLEEFHIRIKATYYNLKLKHRREHLKFRHRQRATMIVAETYFRKGSLISQRV